MNRVSSVSETPFSNADLRTWLESGVLVGYLLQSRWFGGKARGLSAVRIGEVIPVAADSALVLVEAHYERGEKELYQLPLRVAPPDHTDAGAAIVGTRGGVVVSDALVSAQFREGLWHRLSETPAPASRVVSAEQSNSSLLYGARVFVKVFRRIQPGLNPDAEILRFLTEERHFPHVPAFVGAVEQPIAGAGPALLSIAISAVENRGDAWAFTLGELQGFYSRVPTGEAVPAAAIREAIGPEFLRRVRQLGTRTGELHIALAGPTENPDFAPEPLEAADFAALQTNVRGLWQEVLTTAPAPAAGQLLELDDGIRRRIGQLTAGGVAATKTRTHGDYHLGQVLETRGDFVIIDFEGEPARTIEERRRKMSPVRDVAGMLRSLHYAAHAARPDESARVQACAEAWTAETTSAFLDAWKAATAGGSFRPGAGAGFDFLLNAFLLEKAIYEVRYELNNRPTWLPIPLRGLQRLVAGA